MTTQTEIELIAWHPTGFRQSFVVHAEQSVLIGKSANCGVRLKGHDIADIHCTLGFSEGKIWVQDWMSSAGTKVNGELIHTRTHVGQGCVVELGSYKIQLSKADKSVVSAKPNTDVAPQPNPTEAPVTKASQAGDQAPSTLPETVEQPALRNKNVEHEKLVCAEPNSSFEPDTKLESQRPLDIKSDSTSAFDLLLNEDELVDRETVELLLAEIDDLRTALAQSDSQRHHVTQTAPLPSTETEESDRVVQRIQELSEEANRAEERVLILEEMLHAAEDANRAEIEERAHLEAWVGDIEKRIGQRESEHAAELEALRQRLQQADKHNERLQQRLRQNSAPDEAQSKKEAELLGSLQQENRDLQTALADVTKDLRQLKQKFENQSEHSDVALREERAKIAREHAEVSRMKFEYAQKIQELEELPKAATPAEPALQGLREHRQYLREMSKQKKEPEATLSLTGRLKRIWNSME